MSQVIYPRISEKAFAHATDKNVYTFVVPANVNKFEIKKSIENQYEVTVTGINVSILKGKNKRFTMRRGRQSIGYRQDVKKAYVTLKDGDSIPVFAAEEPETAVPEVSTGRVKTKKEKK